MVEHRLDPEQKDTLVREGLANPGLVSKLCAEYNVFLSSYYRWRNDFLLPRRDRENWVEEFIIYNCKEALPPKVANCLRQVFYRMPTSAALVLLNNPRIFIVYVDSFATRAYRVACPAHSIPLEDWIHIVTLTQEAETISNEHLVAIIAHELAHVYLQHDSRYMTSASTREEVIRNIFKLEEDANNLVKKWGFSKELEIMQQQWPLHE